MMTIKQILDSWLVGFDGILTGGELADVYQALAVIVPTVLVVGAVASVVALIYSMFGGAKK